MEERKKNANLEKELEEVKLWHNINTEHWIKDAENHMRAENERKKIEKCLTTTIVDKTWAEEVLAAT